MTAPTPRGEQSPEQAGEAWRNVKRDGMPPCDHEAVFVGINTNGFACCFNEVTHDGVCSMAGPEFSTVLMSGLEWWRVLDRPGSALPPAPREMSDSEIDAIWHRMGSFVPNDHRIFARAILAASAPKGQGNG